MDRRTFLARAAALGASLGLGAVAAACGATAAGPTSTTGPRRSTTRSTGHEMDGLEVSDAVVEENARKGTLGWVIPRSLHAMLPEPIEGYLDHVSARPGDVITLFVNTIAPRFRATVYRIGFYGGLGARLVETSPELPGVAQPAPRFTTGVNMIECDWSKSWQTVVGPDWPSGAYLIKLEGSRRQQSYVPLTVRDDESTSAYVVQSSVTTWQAYNPYGGYSLYGGEPDGGLANRSRIVSYDRPYGHSKTALDAHGSGDFLGNELPFIYFAERHGLDVSYWTDIDLHARPHLLANHRCLISLGHDEYWSMTMRDAVQAAIPRGLNVTFLGANACYRQIRLEDSPLGSDRRAVCYKDAAEDPITKTDPALSTGGSWATDPVPRPESDLIGIMYQSYMSTPPVPLVVAEGASWVFDGTALRTGDTVPALVGSEFDGFEPRLPRPPGPVEILAHSPTTSVSGRGYSDMTYYAVPAAGGVFASGTASFVSAMWDGIGSLPGKLGFGVENRTPALLSRITLNVLAAFGHGPAGAVHRSRENWTLYYSPNTPSKGSVDVP